MNENKKKPVEEIITFGEKQVLIKIFLLFIIITIVDAQKIKYRKPKKKIDTHKHHLILFCFPEL